MKLQKFEQLPLGMVKFSLIITKAALANRIAAIAFTDASTQQKTQSKEDRWARAVNECILSEFPPIYEAVLQKQKIIPIADPDFELLTVDMTQDMQVVARLQTLPSLSLDQYTGFTEKVQVRKPRELQRALYINQNYGAEAREKSGDEQAMALLHKKAEQELIKKGHSLAITLAEQRLINQIGLHVKGELPKDMLQEYYHKEKQRFSVQMQSQKLNLDVYLEQRGQTIESFRTEMHSISEQKLRAQLGLLLIAQKENLAPSEDELQTAFNTWLATSPKDKTFEANDRQKIYRSICKQKASAFVLAHSTLIER